MYSIVAMTTHQRMPKITSYKDVYDIYLSCYLVLLAILTLNWKGREHICVAMVTIIPLLDLNCCWEERTW